MNGKCENETKSRWEFYKKPRLSNGLRIFRFHFGFPLCECVCWLAWIWIPIKLFMQFNAIPLENWWRLTLRKEKDRIENDFAPIRGSDRRCSILWHFSFTKFINSIVVYKFLFSVTRKGIKYMYVCVCARVFDHSN